MREKNARFLILMAGLFIVQQSFYGQKLSPKITENSVVFAVDSRGNTVPDYSYCGYHYSESTIPTVKNVIQVSPINGDNSINIQRAIDYVSTLPMDKNGFRGAILLRKGTYQLNNRLHIGTSGVVLRGEVKKQTILIKTGVDRTSMLRIEGKMNRVIIDTLPILNEYVPVNSISINSNTQLKLKKGDRVLIKRPSTKEWIESVGCDIYGGGISALGWKPGDIDITWDRTIKNVESGRITLSAPLTTALDRKWGNSQIFIYKWDGRINESGIENLTLVSEYDKSNLKDEDHCWTAISVENAENCWVRKVDFRNFAGSAVILQNSASNITVEDCISRNPVSEIGGLRRNTFYTMGQLNLFQRCYSELGIHDFSAGYCATGPNAFVQCESRESLGFSGSTGAWASGLLFDIVNIDGHNLSFRNLGQDKGGSGWNSANSMFWQCSAAEVECYSPASDAKNYAYGTWAQFSGNGEWGESNNHVNPRSLFYAQLSTRLGKDVSNQARILPRNTNASSSPTVDEAAKMAKEAFLPKLTLENWIESDSLIISSIDKKVKDISTIRYSLPITNSIKNDFALLNGRITLNSALLVGGKQEVPWWNGRMRVQQLNSAKEHITRFVPDREGNGLTDRIDTVVATLKSSGVIALDHNYGLWYDRRRDDHERIRRRDGDVWGPFYDQPFARSGNGIAWDGLSKYDLTKPNKWYWSRLAEYATKAALNGLLLYHENYFQHNIIEAGAHWVDSPWRSANNINNTDFPEPVPFTGDKRIFMADHFYDINHPIRRELHRQYIRQCLNNFADDKNVIQFISAEYTGPLHFVQFWIDVIAEWEKETGKKPIIALSTTKDVQDSILADSQRSKIIDLIDIRYWHYKNDGTTYAPEGGKNLAPRQHMRVNKVGKITPNEAYKAVKEYRDKYPEKGVTFYSQNYPEMGWAVFFAGGSCPVIPFIEKDFLKDAVLMSPTKDSDDSSWKMGKSGTGYIIFSQKKGDISASIDNGDYKLFEIDPITGKTKFVNKQLIKNNLFNYKASKNILWLKKI